MLISPFTTTCTRFRLSAVAFATPRPPKANRRQGAKALCERGQRR